MAQQRRKRRTDPDVQRLIEDWAREGWSGPKIMAKLLDDPKVGERTPSLRTIQDLMRDAPQDVPDESGWWSAGTADAEEAALVLPVIGELLRREMARTISRNLARQVARLRTIAPEMPLYTVYQMALRYLMAEGTGASTQYLDSYMALELWRSPLMERGAVHDELIPMNWWYVGPKADTKGNDQ